MIVIIKTSILIMLVLAIVAGPAMAQQTTAGAGATATGTDDTKTFTLGDQRFSINTINQVDAMRLQEMGVQTVSVPGGTGVHVANSAWARDNMTSTEKGPNNMIAFGPGGFVGAGIFTGAAADKSMPTFTFTGNAGQY